MFAASAGPLVSWINVHRLTKTGVSPVSSVVQDALDRVQQRLEIIQRVQVLQSIVVNSPIVVGCFRSTILLPASFISGVPVSQLQAILAHELAHVRRYDYLVNLLQTLVETLFFYHPAVWWISHRIRDERENCCDDLVVAVLGNKIEYGRALLAVEEFRSTATSSLALSAKGGSLLTRVKRVVGGPGQDNSSSSGMAAIGILLAMIAAVGIWSSGIVDADEAAEKAELSASFVAHVSDNISVELVALLPHWSEADSAWMPNGRMFATPPEIPLLGEASRLDPMDNIVDVCLRFTGIGDTARVEYRFPGARTAVPAGTNAAIRVSFEPDENVDVCNLRVGIAEATWGPWLQLDRDGKSVPSFDVPPEFREVYSQIKPDGIATHGDWFELSWSGQDPLDDIGIWEAVAVKARGRQIGANARSKLRIPARTFHNNQFDVPITEVDHFEYRLRPYRHWVTFENVALKAGKKTDVKITTVTVPANADDETAFGRESHGLQFRLVALSPDVNDNAPDLNFVRNDWVQSKDMTFGVELKNVGTEPLTLAGVRYGDNFANEVRGTLRTEMIAPHWFEFEFTDMAGRPVPRTHREYFHQWGVVDSASTHKLEPGQSLTEVLSPAKFNTPMDFDLPPGKYKVRVRYHGPDDELRENVRKHWPDKPILIAWPHDVVSNSVEFEVKQPSRRTKPEDLVWGKPVDGLQAALEYRLPDDVTGNPLESPGVRDATSIGVVVHLKNVIDKPITFVSETGRQGDYVHVVNERGEKVEVKSAFFTGWPIDVAWTLEPGETAQLSLLTPGLGSLDQSGKYTVRYTVRFNSRQQKDDAGNVIFPRPGDYDKEVDTGNTPLFLY